MFEMESMAIAMPEVDRHPNRRAFSGVLTLVDEASDRPPSGARGHRVMLSSTATERALPSLLGMALDYTPALDRHDARCKVGIITAAEIDLKGSKGGQKLLVQGYLFAKDFPEIVQEIATNGRARLGMSYEIADVRVADVNAKVWTIVDCTFTGAAVLLREKAAYGETSIELN